MRSEVIRIVRRADRNTYRAKSEPMLRHASRDPGHDRHSPGGCHETVQKAEPLTHVRLIVKRESKRCVRLAANGQAHARNKGINAMAMR